MWPLRTFCCIVLVSTTFINQNTKIQTVVCGRRFLANILLPDRFKVYVASQVVYKCGHCEHFAEQFVSLKPPWAKICKFKRVVCRKPTNPFLSIFLTSLTAKNYNLTIEITIDNNIAKDSHEKRMIFFPKPKRIWLY